METLWKTYGHQPVKSILEKQLESKKFPHTYLFTGPEGVGKKTLALDFACKILETENLKNHPDFSILESSQEISVETIRDFLPHLSFKPFLSKKKVAIIDNAHNLNVQSSNALLKTLEEPTASTIIILVSSSGTLLPTITSRSQVLNFNSFSKNQLEEFAKTQSKKYTSEQLDLSFGRTSRFLSFFEEKNIFTETQEKVQIFEELKKSALAEKILRVSKFAEAETEDLAHTFNTWYNWQVTRLSVEPEKFKILDALTEALSGLKNNKNKKLVLQGLFLKL